MKSIRAESMLRVNRVDFNMPNYDARWSQVGGTCK